MYQWWCVPEMIQGSSSKTYRQAHHLELHVKMFPTNRRHHRKYLTLSKSFHFPTNSHMYLFLIDWIPPRPSRATSFIMWMKRPHFSQSMLPCQNNTCSQLLSFLFPWLSVTCSICELGFRVGIRIPVMHSASNLFHTSLVESGLFVIRLDLQAHWLLPSFFEH